MKNLLPACAFLLLAACATRGPESLLRDRDAFEPARIQAVAQVSNPDLLWQTMARAGDLITVRQAAAKRLWSLDPDAFWKRMEKDYAKVNHGEFWQWLCKEAGKAKEKRALRAMVLSWGKLEIGTPEEDRLEGPCIASICGMKGWLDHQHDPADGTPYRFLWNVVCQKQMKGDLVAQKSAWLAVARFDMCFHDDALKGELDEIPSGGALDDLKAMAPLLGCMPHVEEELDILKVQSSLVSSRERSELSSLTSASIFGSKCAARHLPLIRRSLHGYGGGQFSVNWGQERPDHVSRTTDAPLISGTEPQDADASVCDAVYAAIHTDTVASALFAEADADLADTRTEHGGLLCWNAENVVLFEAIPAVSRRHDQIYLPPESLFEKLRDGLAHVHFHAQKYDNAEYAGPGKGDLEFVERNRVNAVVFTFVDKDTLNADAYFPGKIVVDLGCIKRPK